MNKILETRFEELHKDIKVLNFEKLIEIELDVLENITYLVDDSVNITPEQFKESHLEKFNQLAKQEGIEEDFNRAINIDKSINSEKLNIDLKKKLISVINTIVSETFKPIEAISFQYNYEPKFSILCDSNGKYESNKTDKYLDLGDISFYLEDEIDFSNWLEPIINLENKYPLFIDFELQSFFKLKDCYYLNLYLYLEQNLYEIFKENIAFESIFEQQLYFYVNELDCEQTFLLKLKKSEV